MNYRVVLGVLMGLLLSVSASTASAVRAHALKPRLVMVEFEHWRTAFFSLPEELPVLLEAGTNTITAHLHDYDFTEGMKAMMVFLSLRPKDAHAPAYRQFLKKWPLYQAFFKHIGSRDYEAAKQRLEEIRKLAPQEPALDFYQGSLNSQTGDYQEAENNYLACLKKIPDYGPTYINLARLAKARGAVAEARDYLQSALQQIKPSEQGTVRMMAQKMLATIEKEKQQSTPSQ